ncbi:MAG TPA: hypothetical protein VFF68_05650, partial [Anaerolineaceae bacterium]|nr:hypothetical protein [Anaerolineaceae bacterium]
MNMEKLQRILGRIPLHLVIILLCLIWIIPTVGLLVTSFRPLQDINASGWWTAFNPRTQATGAYADWCASCHGDTGDEVPGVTLSDPAVSGQYNRSLRLLALLRSDHPDLG